MCLKFATPATFFDEYLSIYRRDPEAVTDDLRILFNMDSRARPVPHRPDTLWTAFHPPLFREYDMWKQLLAAVMALAAAASMAAVDVNKATVADLDSIKGIGPGTSAKIMEARQKSPFKDWNDLISRVPGIGEKRAAKLSSEGLTVQGEGYKGAASAAKPEKAEKVAKVKEAKAGADDKKPQKP
jgi:competence protein ComEA